VLLWTSSRWQTSDKVLGTLVWPAGLALAGLLALVLGHAALPVRLLILTVILATIAAAVVVAVRLLRRAAQAPA